MTPTSTANLVKIRWGIKCDLTQVHAIETAAFGMNAWTWEELNDVLRGRKVVLHVAEIGDEIVGFVVYVLERQRITILDLAVRPERQGRGIGAMLTQHVLTKFKPGRHRAQLVISESNLDGQLFLRRMGFVATEVLRDHCDDGQDGYRMVYDTCPSF